MPRLASSFAYPLPIPSVAPVTTEMDLETVEDNEICKRIYLPISLTISDLTYDPIFSRVREDRRSSRVHSRVYIAETQLLQYPKQ